MDGSAKDLDIPELQGVLLFLLELSLNYSHCAFLWLSILLLFCFCVKLWIGASQNAERALDRLSGAWARDSLHKLVKLSVAADSVHPVVGGTRLVSGPSNISFLVRPAQFVVPDHSGKKP